MILEWVVYEVLNEKGILYTHCSTYEKLFDQYLCKHFEKLSKDYKWDEDFQLSMFNFWIQLIDVNPYSIPKNQLMTLHEIAYTYHYIVKIHPVTRMMKEHLNTEETMFIYSYYIAEVFRQFQNEALPSSFHEKINAIYEKIRQAESLDIITEDEEVIRILKMQREHRYKVMFDANTKSYIHEMLHKAYEAAMEYIQEMNVLSSMK